MREVTNANGDKENVWIQCRLDKAFGNAEWFRLFPRVHMEYLVRLESDHKPLLTRLAAGNQRQRGRFYLDKQWCEKAEAHEVIKASSNHTLNGISSVSDRIACCSKELVKWKRSSNSNCKVLIRKLRRNLEMESSKISPDFSRVSGMKFDLEKAYREEEIFWKHKSKDRWLEDGDKNTVFPWECANT